MPGGIIKVNGRKCFVCLFGVEQAVLQSTTTLEDNKLFTASIAPDGGKVTRTYEFDDEGCTIVSKKRL